MSNYHSNQQFEKPVLLGLTVRQNTVCVVFSQHDKVYTSHIALAQVYGLKTWKCGDYYYIKLGVLELRHHSAEFFDLVVEEFYKFQGGLYARANDGEGGVSNEH